MKVVCGRRSSLCTCPDHPGLLNWWSTIKFCQITFSVEWWRRPIKNSPLCKKALRRIISTVLVLHMLKRTSKWPTRCTVRRFRNVAYYRGNKHNNRDLFPISLFTSHRSKNSCSLLPATWFIFYAYHVLIVLIFIESNKVGKVNEIREKYVKTDRWTKGLWRNRPHWRN